jgi:hypothetical protein
LWCNNAQYLRWTLILFFPALIMCSYILWPLERISFKTASIPFLSMILSPLVQLLKFRVVKECLECVKLPASVLSRETMCPTPIIKPEGDSCQICNLINSGLKAKADG